jgi:hypothetical protein
VLFVQVLRVGQLGLQDGDAPEQVGVGSFGVSGFGGRGVRL